MEHFIKHLVYIFVFLFLITIGWQIYELIVYGKLYPNQHDTWLAIFLALFCAEARILFERYEKRKR
ncbi:hypothetical protein AOX59_18790 [Lentibacillus amyloliquefaciens]|uniref:Uncharacterized protein n=1 Tax=Lentibacillus amyloliquefaciens TaxID=1472767 RepID=A0A0U4FP52_9BACI|nr:hypothetical protein AOX59_18790 [Lentibacillus amyloliquefaciens]